MSLTTEPASAPARRLGVLTAVYLLGIFMGAIDTGIVTPARTIIQNDLGVDDQTGIWMLTIYTLAYAAAIPVMGKLADRYGRKPIYLISITLFGVGSLLCGLSQDFGSFGMLIAARAIQAVGGGGIVPIATAEFGTSFPPEKRGMALGLVGGVYGVANIFGSSAGSLILGIFGAHNWQFIFYVNVPISIAIIIAGLVFLPNHKVEQVSRIDLLGITLLVAMILSVLYGLRNLDFFDLANSITGTDVYPYLLGFVVLLPLFVLAERRAADPVLNLRYFTEPAIVVTLALSFISGVILMGVIFVPQFAENALRIPTGEGGYFVIILGLFSGIGAPLSGRFTDRFGPRPVFGFGVAVSAIAAAVGAWWAIPSPSWWSVCSTLALMGLGLGFTIGSPLNYMMLERTPAEESNSALATLSLVRSIGTTIAPAVLVGFLAQAGTALPDALVAQLPQTVTAPALPYAAELQAKFAELKADDRLAEKLAGVEFPDLAANSTIELSLDGDGSLPDDLLELLKTADVTTITERTRIVAERMFEEQTPAVIADITAGVNTGLTSLADARTELSAAQADLVDAVEGVDKGIAGMDKAAKGMRSGIAGMTKAIAGMDSGLAGTAKAIAGLEKAIKGVGKGISGLDKAIAGQGAGLAQVQAAYDQLMAALPPGTPEPPPAQALKAQIGTLKSKLADTRKSRAKLVAKQKTLKKKLKSVRTERTALAEQRAAMVAKRSNLRTQLASLEDKRADAVASRKKLVKASDEVADAVIELDETKRKLTTLRDAVPGAFETAKDDYLAEISARSPKLEATFANTLNQGFRDIYLATLVASLLAAALLGLPAGRGLRTGR
ncbi:MAG TPA: MFS transporter [Propionicimonas sp.]|nr:MFS transporter [Propionicimonas sp.]HRA05177.1 MFS transporter [Propionicimonas sp.]